VFVDAAEHDVRPSQIVATDIGGEETLAMIVFSPRQVLANESSTGPTGRLLRLANQDESLTFMRSHTGEPLQAAPPTEWLVEPGVEAVVLVASEQGEPSAAEVIERLFPTERMEASQRRIESPGTPGEG
jgi:hypothetical protein